jgi:hypothetical protein
MNFPPRSKASNSKELEALSVPLGKNNRRSKPLEDLVNEVFVLYSTKNITIASHQLAKYTCHS